MKRLLAFILASSLVCLPVDFAKIDGLYNQLQIPALACGAVFARLAYARYPSDEDFALNCAVSLGGTIAISPGNFIRFANIRLSRGAQLKYVPVPGQLTVASTVGLATVGLAAMLINRYS